MYMGIDLGTSGVKAVVLSANGDVVGQGQATLEISRPNPLWSEQDPADWWSATNQAIALIAPELRREVRAIGLAGQMHGAVLLDEGDKVLRPAILWNDGRSHEECSALEKEVPQSREITGNLMMPGFTAPKVAWVRNHEPEVFNKIATVLLPKDFLRLCMTGDKASDMSDSAGTQWLDVARRSWSSTMLEATGLTQRQMPQLYEGCDIAGVLEASVAADWGMARVPVVGGAGDNAAGAIGVGVIADGDAMLSLGTSGVIFAATCEFSPNPGRAVHAFCHCLPEMWHQMTVHLSAASCLDWAARQLNYANAHELIESAMLAGCASGPEIFVPYLSGERTPHNDPHVRAAWMLLNNETSPGRLASAVLEGIAFAHADGLNALRQAGTHIDRLSVIGGGSRSRYWGKIIASALDLPIDYLEGGEVGPALGAARLAILGVTKQSPSEVCIRPPVIASAEPDPAMTELLAPKFANYLAAYPGLAALS